MKKTALCILTALLMVLSGCGMRFPEVPPVTEAVTEAATQGRETTAANTEAAHNLQPATPVTATSDEQSRTPTEANNLPESFTLSMASKKGSWAWMSTFSSYSFTLEVPTELTMGSEISAGDIELGIRYWNSKEYLYDKQDFNNKTDTLVLEPGNYYVILSGTLYNGTLNITGEAVAQ